MCTIIHSKDIAKTPEYLSVEFFKEVLEYAVRKTNIRLHCINVSMGSATGENYCSQIYRVRIDYMDVGPKNISSGDHKQFSVIVKSIPKSEVAEFLEDLEVYLKEKITYYELLPRLETIIGGGRRFGPRLYQSLKTPVNTLVFEDLAQTGFEMASRETGLDEIHCRKILQRLAEFHAASMVLAETSADMMDSYEGGMLAKQGLEQEDNMLMRYFGGMAMQTLQLASTWPGYEQIVKKLQNYIDNLRENLIRSQAPVADEIKVLNHGDLWVNNILFKYNKKRQVEDLRFIDFQMSVWGSPGIDLNYFFYTSMHLEVLKHKREELIKEYHSKLCETLRRMNYTHVPSYQQIRQEVHRREAYGFFANYGILPTISLDKSASSDNNLDSLADDEFAKNKMAVMFQSKRLAETLRYTLKRFDELGVLD